MAEAVRMRQWGRTGGSSSSLRLSVFAAGGPAVMSSHGSRFTTGQMGNEGGKIAPEEQPGKIGYRRVQGSEKRRAVALGLTLFACLGLAGCVSYGSSARYDREPYYYYYSDPYPYYY